MQAGDLLLVDAAANYQGMTGDITRTYPVSGAFSEPQKGAVPDRARRAGRGDEAAQAGNKTSDVEKASEEVAKAELLSSG